MNKLPTKQKPKPAKNKQQNNFFNKEQNNTYNRTYFLLFINFLFIKYPRYVSRHELDQNLV